MLSRWVWCPDLLIRNRKELYRKGPLLIAANHPNSFLDAVLIASLFRTPVYALARGDVFTHPVAAKILSALNIFPVYRLREGSQHLAHNYTTFDLCIEIFRKNGIVLIFSEGLSVNEWKLRPLKKGTARLALRAWEEGIPLSVLPAGINYSNFGRLGKWVHLLFGKPILQKTVESKKNFGEKVNTFNGVLDNTLKELVYQFPFADEPKRKETFIIPASASHRALLFLPALIGFAMHWPFYSLLRITVGWKLRRSDHFDSILLGTAFLLYPIYLLGILAGAYALTGSKLSLLLAIALPFFARCAIRLKNQFRC